MNFIDTSAFAPLADPAEEEKTRRESRRVWDVPDGATVLFCPRRLVKKNGVIYPSLALAAMEQADRERFLLLHAGEGGERREMERIIRENHLEKNVRLLGGQLPETVRDLYRLADIVLVPSVHSENVEEATSLSALEAMASGRPLIAGEVGGLAEIVVDGENGLLVPADAGALAAAILRLAAAPELGARLAAAAREYVVKNHSHVRAAEAYVEVYRRAADASSMAGAHPAAGPLGAAQPDAQPAPPWPAISVLGFPLDLVTLEEAARWTVDRASLGVGAAGALAPPPAASGRVRTAIAVSFNPELVVRARDDPAAAEVLMNADLCYPDGVGAVWAAGRQGARRAPGGGGAGPGAARHPHDAADRGALERVAGADLAERVLELAAEQGLPVYFLGAAEGVAAEAARRQCGRLPGLSVAGIHHGYFAAAEEADVVKAISDSGARILLVALGAPRQELFLYRYRDVLRVPVGLGVGGSFDVWAGKVKRAPAWVQRAKVEWLYRLAADPRRLRRQAALPRYAIQVLRWSPADYGPARRRQARDTLGGTGTGPAGEARTVDDIGGGA